MATKKSPSGASYVGGGKWKEIWRRFCKSKGAVIGLVVLVLLAAAILLGPVLIPYTSATTQNFSVQLAKPSLEHPFGCDGFGRDILARVIHGGKTSVGIAVLATISSCVFGSMLGAVAGFFGGWTIPSSCGRWTSLCRSPISSSPWRWSSPWGPTLSIC